MNTFRKDADKAAPPPARDIHPLDEGCHKLGGVSRATIYRWEKQHKIKLVRIGGRTFISAGEIARLAANAA